MGLSPTVMKSVARLGSTVEQIFLFNLIIARRLVTSSDGTPRRFASKFCRFIPLSISSLFLPWYSSTSGYESAKLHLQDKAAVWPCRWDCARKRRERRAREEVLEGGGGLLWRPPTPKRLYRVYVLQNISGDQIMI